MMQTKGEILSANLKRARNQLRLTQSEAAKQLNVSRQAISNWETGRNLPDVLLLQQAAVVYQTSVDALMNVSAVTTISTKFSKVLLVIAETILVTSRMTQLSTIAGLRMMDGLIVIVAMLLFIFKIRRTQLVSATILIGVLNLIAARQSQTGLNFGMRFACFAAGILLLLQAIIDLTRRITENHHFQH
ncbi:MAG: helix-turn-helix domain-containing protein [Furfurilactobacillus sp.]|uniref:Helix-turn-helix domain-containing protein n=2 Tax=Furfurilactobacillus TaxID=2767882 RepID=A0ABT6DAU5_9LACO|nr:MULTISPECIES: helix-turn-helix transcriptional regulator [Furfurilactobacillus]QLE67563.1 Transcriptional regulator XRE [Furfurilactobacillus rossiae]MCF6161381.1 helix-turn-helix domain-containing protein [Furfurilactobacillus milii]MCF6163761.1 helix-turn-helix domain-containing protein [Furfurilactobacillus milii]MCF6419561.1 helix-turn-helix domain-containing protein [Furfurilactobacillus milii]MCH4011692.1 helix-turn-helix domain-containing protein [Furfurilactobacillus sp.]